MSKARSSEGSYRRAQVKMSRRGTQQSPRTGATRGSAAAGGTTAAVLEGQGGGESNAEHHQRGYDSWIHYAAAIQRQLMIQHGKLIQYHINTWSLGSHSTPVH